MNPPNYITLLLSGIAICVSIISLIITLVQKRNETHRAIRKTLSDALEAIAKINVDALKIDAETNISEDDKVSFRRSFNSHRRILVVHADFLLMKYPHMVTDIDCNLLAHALSFIGDFEKSDFYWKKAVEKSPSQPLKHMNLRGYALFLFRMNKIDEARERFSEACNIKLESNDENNALMADTYCMHADYEKTLDKALFDEQINGAMEYCVKIGNPIRRDEMQSRIRELLSK